MPLTVRAIRPEMPLAAVPRALGLPRVGQLGYLVDDVDVACRRRGAELGVTTWYRPRIRRCELHFGGRRLDQRFDIAIGYANGVQVEIWSVDGADRDQLAQGLTGRTEPHHIGIFVENADTAEARLNELGSPTLVSGWFSFASRSKTRVAYVDTRSAHGIIVELIENRFRGIRFDMPEWYVRFGAVAGLVSWLE
jgi:Glyoxalase/Bleomycin resistance protein/Dioxygenase superfamily